MVMSGVTEERIFNVAVAFTEYMQLKTNRAML